MNAFNPYFPKCPLLFTPKNRAMGLCFACGDLGYLRRNCPRTLSSESAGRKLYPSISTRAPTCKSDEMRVKVANMCDEKIESHGEIAAGPSMTSCVATADGESCNNLSVTECPHVHICTSQPIVIVFAHDRQVAGSIDGCYWHCSTCG